MYCKIFHCTSNYNFLILFLNMNPTSSPNLKFFNMPHFLRTKHIRNTYRQFLETNFQGLRLRKPLFYSWPVGLRFDLQTEPFYTEECFKEVNHRASTLFQTAFEQNDEILVVLSEHAKKKGKIRTGNFIFKQIQNLNYKEIFYLKEKELYHPNDKNDQYNFAVIPTSITQINFKTILESIANIDHPTRRPRFDNNKCLPTKEIYLLNLNKKVIFNMYDDRGLDIIGADKEIIHSIFKKHNEWILEFDRERIEKQFTV